MVFKLVGLLHYKVRFVALSQKCSEASSSLDRGTYATPKRSDLFDGTPRFEGI